MGDPGQIPGLWVRLGSKTKKEISEEGNSKLFHSCQENQMDIMHKVYKNQA